MSSQYTVIIAHGAFMQPSIYQSFTLALSKVGISKVRVPQLPSSDPSPPGDGFAKDVKVLQEVLSQELESGNDILIVAHSYGSMPLTEALTGISSEISNADKIAGIVFVAAMVPDQGESLATAMKTGVAPWVRIDGAVCYADNPAGVFFNTLHDPALLESAVAAIYPQASAAFITPVTEATWRHYRCAYVRTMLDQSTTLPDQDHMIEKLKRETTLVRKVDVESDHCPFLGMPDDLAGIIVNVMRS